jgi:hypothetical protein
MNEIAEKHFKYTESENQVNGKLKATTITEQ